MWLIMKFDLCLLLTVSVFALFLSHAVAARSGDHQGMVSAADPRAARAGVEILRKGGSALDAVIAAQMVLNLVEPQSAGIGGGGFLLHWDAPARNLTTFDGRETASLFADGNLFASGGKPMRWEDAVVGGRSVGTPGLIAMLRKAHKKHGKLKWKELFQPAIKLSKEGFRVSPLLNGLIGKFQSRGLGKYAQARLYFFAPSGEPVAVNSILKNPQLAKTFEELANGGASVFYDGAMAHRIVGVVENAGGILSIRDLRGYRAVSREPVCSLYRSYLVCGMGPPTSGGMTVIQILKLLERFDVASLRPMSVEAAHLFTQAAKLAYADRNSHMADSDFYPVPAEKLTDAEYLKKRSALIDPGADMGKASTGIKGGCYAQNGGVFEFPSTTHISAVDRRGNAVSMTASIENAFGSTLMTGGFLLNNQLTDFSFSTFGKNDCLIPNRVEPGKRPRSSMSPMVVFDLEGNLRLIIGSPGGSRIINYVARAIVAVLDWGLDVQSAVSLPHYANRNGKTELELGTQAENLASGLRKLGHEVKITELRSGLHGIEFTDAGIRGGADPRREGAVLSE